MTLQKKSRKRLMTKSLTSHEILKKSFISKKKKTYGFSIRGLARKMNISHSYLSRVFQGKKGLTKSQRKKLCVLLDMDELAVLQLEKRLAYEASFKSGIDSTDMIMRESSILESINSFDQIHEKHFSLYDEWYLIPLMDLVTCDNYQSELAWSAKKLGITVGQVASGYKKLQDLGYIKIEDNVRVKVNRKMRVATLKSIDKIRAYHKVMMLKAIAELEKKTDPISFEKRLISGICIAVNPKQLPEAKQVLQAALLKVSEILSVGKCSEIYHLTPTRA